MQYEIVLLCVPCVVSRAEKYIPKSASYTARCRGCKRTRLCGLVRVRKEVKAHSVRRCPTCKQVVRD